MKNELPAMFRSWLNVFLSATIASLLALLLESGIDGLDTRAFVAVLVSGAVAVLPVIKNYLDTNDPRYGKVKAE
jgi:hypothetical protein